MDNEYTIGNIYILNPDVDLHGVPAKEASRYKRIAASKAPLFVAVRKASDKRTVFAPLYKEQFKRCVVIALSGVTYYANCSALPRVPSGWLTESSITEKVTPEVLDEIKAKNTQWQQKINNRHKKRQQKENAKWAALEVEISASRKAMPTAKPPSSVVWKMAHPFQGGSVTPK